MKTRKKRLSSIFQNKSFLSNSSSDIFLNDRGITLPTVIIAAILALAAAAAGVVIYNAIRGKADNLDDTAAIVEDVRNAFDTDPDIQGEQGARQGLDRLANDKFEDDEATVGDEISDVLYVAENLCPDYEIRQWNTPLDEALAYERTRTSGNRNIFLDLVELDSTISTIPSLPRVYWGGRTTNDDYGLNVSPYESYRDMRLFVNARSPSIKHDNNNWITEDGFSNILSPVLKSDRCSYLATNDHDTGIALFNRFNRVISSPTSGVPRLSRRSHLEQYSSSLNTPRLLFTSHSPMKYNNCLMSGLAPSSISTEEACELHFAASTVPVITHSLGDLPQKYSSAVGGTPSGGRVTYSYFSSNRNVNVSRASWQLISYCAISGGYIPRADFAPWSASPSYSNLSKHHNKCIVTPEDFHRTCSLASLGLVDPDTDTALYGFSVRVANGKCEITEATSREVGKVSTDSTSTRTTYTKLPIPATPSTCPDWEIESSNVSGTRTGGECEYPLSNATDVSCNRLGLKLKTAASSCSYTVADSNPECPTKFRVSLETGRASCVEPFGSVPKQWESVCLGWKNTQTTMYDHDGDDDTPQIADDSSSVYAYYSTSTNTYRCSFKNTHANAARECLSFGYQPGRVGECEVVGKRSYNPRPFAPTCAVMRATPYHTSQEQLFSIAGLELALRNRASISGNIPTDIPGTFRNFSTAIDNNDFIYDHNRVAAPNINKQLSYYYKRIIKPAVESYLPSTTTSPRYNELWLPSQFPTGNVSLSRTFSQESYPSKFSKPDPTENSLIDFLYNRRAPDGFNDCDNYKQFYHPIHIEKSSSTTETYTTGYNDQNKTLVCGVSSQNFWEPRYYLDVLSSGDPYPSGNYCPSSTTACPTPPTGSKLYRECSLTGTDTAFTRPAEISDSSFVYDNTITHPMNSYIKECEDIGYSGGTAPELFDYKVFENVQAADRLRVGVYPPPEYTHHLTQSLDYITAATVGAVRVLTGTQLNAREVLVRQHLFGNRFTPYSAVTKYWVSPLTDIKGNYTKTSFPTFVTNIASSIEHIERHDNLWYRSDVRTSAYSNVLDSTDTYLFWLLTDEGLKFTQYGISEMLNYINSQAINSTGTDVDLYRSAELRFSNDANFNSRDFSSISGSVETRTLTPVSPGDPTASEIGYFNASTNGFAASRGGTSSNLTFYAKYSEQNCEFKISQTASNDVKAFFRACQSLSTYFPTRFSYHKPIEVRDFTVASITFRSDGTLPTQDDFGHWRQALINDTNKDPALIKYGDARYNPPTYFHINTNKDNGYFYCEANPNRSTQAGVFTAARTSATTFTVNNLACGTLNQALGITTAPNTIDFEDVTEGTMTQLNTNAKASAIGFIGHKEGPYDYYHCKWRAPFKGNPLAG